MFMFTKSLLTRALLGYFHNATYWGGGLFIAPPLISETTGPIFKIQTASDSPGKVVERKNFLVTSRSPMTSQVRSKSKCLTFPMNTAGGPCARKTLVINANKANESARVVSLTLTSTIWSTFWTFSRSRSSEVTRSKKVKHWISGFRCFNTCF